MLVENLVSCWSFCCSDSHQKGSRNFRYYSLSFFKKKKLMIILFSRSLYGSHSTAVYKISFQGQTLREPLLSNNSHWILPESVSLVTHRYPRTSISFLNIASYYHQESHPTSNQAMELWWGGGAIGWNWRAAEEGQVYRKLCTSCIASDNISFFQPKLAWNYHTSMIR